MLQSEPARVPSGRTPLHRADDQWQHLGTVLELIVSVQKLFTFALPDLSKYSGMGNPVTKVRRTPGARPFRAATVTYIRRWIGHESTQRPRMGQNGRVGNRHPFIT